MASIYRYGFEGGYLPKGVSSTGSYTLIAGRSGASSSAVKGNSTAESFITMDLLPTSEVLASFQAKLLSLGTGAETTFFRFGPAEVTYTPTTSTIKLKSNGVLLSSLVQTLPSNFYLPLAVRAKLGVAGTMSFSLDTFLLSYTGDTLQGSTNANPAQLWLGLGATTNTCQLVLDDVAVNNGVTGSNISGSWGLEDVGQPPFIACSRNLLTTGSYSGWSKLDTFSGTPIIDIVNGVPTEEYIKATTFDTLSTFGMVPLDTSSITSFEGANVYVDTAYTIQSTQSVWLESYLQLTGSGSGSVNRSENYKLRAFPMNTSYSALEKDTGGRMSIADFNASQLYLSPKKFLNTNFFGEPDQDSVVLTGSVVLGGSGDDFEFFGYENLTIASGAFVTTSTKKKGLVIYVKSNCVIEGTLSMDGKGRSGSLSDLPTSVWKNVTSSFVVESASFTTDSTWPLETTYQAYQALVSEQFGVSTSSVAFGFGGAGGNTSAAGGAGATGSFYAGGLGGGGAAAAFTGSAATDLAVSSGAGGNDGGGTIGGNGAANSGGSIFIFVGGHLILGSTGLLTATGSQGANGVGSLAAGGGGGAGGGMIRAFYGVNFYNFGGTFQVNGGLGGTGLNGGTNGLPGSSGSLQIIKLLSN